MSKPVSNSKAVATKKKETTNGKVDSPAMKEKIQELATALKASQNASFEVGKICDEIVALEGIRHGKHTLQTIARRPEIRCDPRELRRCWQYYRLVINKGCQSPELDKLTKTKPRGVKELARIIDTDMTEGNKAGLVKALASESVSKNLTVPDMAKRVTNELKLRNMLRRNPPEKKKQANESESQPNGIPAAVDSETIKQHAECVLDCGESGKATSIKDQCAVKAELVAAIDKVERQAAQLKTDREYADFLFKPIQRLERIRRSLLGKDSSDVTQINQQVA